MRFEGSAILGRPRHVEPVIGAARQRWKSSTPDYQRRSSALNDLDSPLKYQERDRPPSAP
jgi:hypothetical protein